ncbi:hypothetical protein AQJ30_12905 [Streptomyces longwoodensis]|uniref:Uncharacterized protein n=1 Tax=Streptomyces longwoodensis TaxID=68231 RepID=A0A101QYJ7_9ACTN|nr:hypothetical protein AQJ30_12905 [Streptomyces longwoodensis]
MDLTKGDPVSDTDREQSREPETVVEEVMREVEDAETRVTDRDDRHGARRAGDGDTGEAGEAITPNTRAQEESRGD